MLAAGNTFTMVAGQDLQQIAQGNHATAVKSGLVFFTYGKATNSQKPNTETGIAFHAASGNVNTQSQSAATKLTADKSVSVSSSSAMVKIHAPQHILLTAAGAAIDLQPGSITLKGPGAIEFKASAKELTGGRECDHARSGIFQYRAVHSATAPVGSLTRCRWRLTRRRTV